MTKKSELLALKIINENGTLKPLLEEGLSYSQIVDMFDDLQNQGLVIETEERLILSDEGKKHIKTQDTNLDYQKSDSFIDDYRLAPQLQTNVYLPSRKKKVNNLIGFISLV